MRPGSSSVAYSVKRFASKRSQLFAQRKKYLQTKFDMEALEQMEQVENEEIEQEDEAGMDHGMDGSAFDYGGDYQAHGSLT